MDYKNIPCETKWTIFANCCNKQRVMDKYLRSRRLANRQAFKNQD